MTLTTMYPGKINSPVTTLSVAASSTDTELSITDLSVLSTDPNLATIGTGSDAETILYSTMSAYTGAGTIGEITRGFQSTNKSWANGTRIRRAFTAYDYDTLRTNITTLDSPNASIMLMPGGAFLPTDNPAGWDQGETILQGNCYQYGSFSATTTNRIQWTAAFPTGWDNNNLTAKIYWTSTSATEVGDVKWDLFAYSFSDTNALDTVLPLVVSVTDSLSTNDVLQVSTESGAFTITGSSKFNIIELQRDYDDATDTLDDYAQILAVEIKYVRSQTY